MKHIWLKISRETTGVHLIEALDAITLKCDNSLKLLDKTFNAQLAVYVFNILSEISKINFVTHGSRV